MTILGLKRDQTPWSTERFSSASKQLTIESKDVAWLDTAQLASATGLKKLSIWDNRSLTALDLAPLSALVALEELTILRNPIETLDLASLAGLPRLKHLALESVEPLALAALSGGFAALCALELRCGAWTALDLEPLRSLPKLQHLYLRQGAFSALDLSPLAAIPRFEKLYLTNTRLKALSLEPFAGHKRLRELHLPDNPELVIDLTPVLTPSLRWVDVQGVRRAWRAKELNTRYVAPYQRGTIESGS